MVNNRLVGFGLFAMLLLLVSLLPVHSATMVALFNVSNKSFLPENWTSISDTAFCSEDSDNCYFYDKYIRFSNASMGLTATGGSNTHTHTLSLQTAPNRNQNVTAEAGLVNGFNVAALAHTHSLLQSVNPANTSLAPAKVFIVARYLYEKIPPFMPQGSIIAFNSTSIPENWTLYRQGDGYFVLGNTTTNDTKFYANISTVNSHYGVVFNTSNPTPLGIAEPGLKASIVSTTHRHQQQLPHNFTENNHTPSYVALPLIMATVDTGIPDGAIGFFYNDTVYNFSNWTVINDWKNKYLLANSTSFNTTGGNLTHSHTGFYGYNTTSVGGTNFLFGRLDMVFPSSGNWHVYNLTMLAVNNTPPYRDVVPMLYKYTPPVIINDTEIPKVSNVILTNKTNISINFTFIIVNQSGTVYKYANYTIRWGNTTSFSNLQYNTTFSTNFSVNWTNLTPNTTYYFNITVCTNNTGGSICNTNQPDEGVYNISTLENAVLDTTPPSTYNHSITNTTNTTATGSYNTSENANQTINFGNTTSLGTLIFNTSFLTTWIFNYSGLLPNTTYYYNLTVCDTSGNCNTTGVHNFTTQENPVVPPMIEDFLVFLGFMMILVTGFFLFLALRLDSTHLIIKILCTLTTLVLGVLFVNLTLLLSQTLGTTNITTNLSTLYTTILYIYLAILLYSIVYGIILLIKTFSKIHDGKTKN